MKKLLVLSFLINLSYAKNNTVDYLQPSPPSTVKVKITTKRTTITEERRKDGSVVELNREEQTIPKDITTEFADEAKINLSEEEKIKLAIKAAKENNDPQAVRELQKRLKNLKKKK